MRVMKKETPMNRIHVCLVSGQPIPNLIPLKMEELKPDKVVLLVSSDMEVQFDRLSSVIKSWDIEVDKLPIEPYDPEAARKTCLDVLSRYESVNITLNVTGGTKIMALAAMDVFREQRKPVMYVDTQNKVIHRLSPTFERLRFKSVIKVKPYLAAHGQKIINSKTLDVVSEKHNSIINMLINNMDKFENAVSDLNKIASKARNAKKFPCAMPLDSHLLSSSITRELLSLYEKNGFLRLNKKDIVFHNQQVVEFISGGWLEEYIFNIVKSLSPTDVLMNVNVEWDQKGIKPTINEYDIVFTMNNQLYLIECKTKRFVGNDKEASNADPIYKLDSLIDSAGGLFGKGMLVSYKKITDEMKDRLKANKLEFCEGNALKNLAVQIRQWLTK